MVMRVTSAHGGHLVPGEHLLGGEDLAAAAWAALTRGGGDGRSVDGRRGGIDSFQSFTATVETKDTERYEADMTLVSRHQTHRCPGACVDCMQMPLCLTLLHCEVFGASLSTMSVP